MVLDIPDCSNDNAKQLNLWQVNGGSNQEFRLNDNGDGTFASLTKISGDTKALDVNSLKVISFIERMIIKWTCKTIVEKITTIVLLVNFILII